MAETRIHKVSLVTWVLVMSTGLSLFLVSERSLWVIATGVAVFVGAEMVTLPAPSGQRIQLGVGVAAAVLVIFNGDWVSTGAVLGLGMAATWFAMAMSVDPRSVVGTRFLAQSVAFSALVGAYTGVLHLSTFGGDTDRLVALISAGLVWYLARAITKALIGLDRQDLSMRYLWLLSLEDWSVVVGLFATGGLFGFAQPVISWWAIPVAGLPYAFFHLAFVRFSGTRKTYGQTIRALSRIPEVGGLAPDGHSVRTADLSVAVAQEMGMHPDDVNRLEYAALMHDIGKVTLNEPAILKAGYTDDDLARWGSQIIGESPYLRPVATIVERQHEPYRRPGADTDPDLPLASKIIKVASAYDQAVVDFRLGPLEALERLHQGAVYEFDPAVTASLRRVLVHRSIVAA
ncbi:MAG: HD domain-containing protein [Acidimicrobiia bacterium]|nr:HD domain-containing protein [Acidimicrobiia bacterium]MBT8214644.1 HD domain-containing protein [Acidimicrobiia bacterium]NNF69118.1 HD domain-containing protein [Acidimicrobiia bacterium]NNK91821.1 HD domain-containing protein [Acidimicrobiia bacterium]